jgi:hypothetical protein
MRFTRTERASFQHRSIGNRVKVAFPQAQYDTHDMRPEGIDPQKQDWHREHGQLKRVELGESEDIYCP